MGTIKQEISDRGIQGSIPNPNEEVTIPETDAESVTTLVAVFGSICAANPQLSQLVNTAGPHLFAALLFTLCEDYEVDPTNPDMVTPRRDVLEAESAAIGMIRAVAQAVGQAYGDITADPSDAEVDDDTDLVPVS